MGDKKVDFYVDLRNSVDKTKKKPFQNLFFLILVYFACLLIGIIILSLSNLSSVLLGGSSIFYVLIVVISLLLGFISYFCFGYFKISKITGFILTFSLSLIISGVVFLINNYVFNLLNSLRNTFISNSPDVFSVLDIFNLSNLPNIWIIFAIFVVLYNLLSIINLFRKD